MRFKTGRFRVARAGDSPAAGLPARAGLESLPQRCGFRALVQDHRGENPLFAYLCTLWPSGVEGARGGGRAAQRAFLGSAGLRISWQEHAEAHQKALEDRLEMERRNQSPTVVTDLVEALPMAGP